MRRNAKLSKLDLLSDNWATRIRKALSSIDSVPMHKVWLGPKHTQVALLNWAVWSMELNLTPREILNFVWRHFGNQPRRPGTIGTNLSAATSPKVREAFREEMGKRSISSKSEAFKSRMLGLAPNIVLSELTQDRLDVAIARYKKATTRRRTLLATPTHKYTRRWRGNPWI